jgi:hypothetical protein
MAINWKFIANLEGGQCLTGYVPEPEKSKSGVTVGTGIDLGQMTETQIEALDIPDTLKRKLTPYAGKIKAEAVAYLQTYPLTITEQEAEALDGAIKRREVQTLVARYDGAIAASAVKFDALPIEVQTVIASVAFQYGTSLDKRTPKFWAAVTSQNWNTTVDVLKNFGDHYSKRRNQEAALLAKILG